MSMTLATTWVRRGVAAQVPIKYEVDEAELGRISKLARLQLEDAQEDLNVAQDTAGQDNEHDQPESEDSDASIEPKNKDPNLQDDELEEYHLDDYDNEAKETSQKFAMFGNVRSLAYHNAGEDDPYLVLPEGGNESEDEREEMQILPTDNLILAARVEDEVAHLEVFVYEDDADNLYVHHDIMLPAVPLCVEWIDVPVGKDFGERQNGNFVAVGTMSPEIEIWDLDVVDNMYPNAILGQEPPEQPEQNGDTTTKKKSKKKKKPKRNDEYHVDAVLALAANRHHRNLLASASADKTVKLWDLNTMKCAKSYSMHTGKVCALDWHPTESTVLLSGSYDRSVVATDMRAPEAEAPKWIVESDVERVRWDIHDPNYFYVTTESGIVHYFDARNPPKDHTSPSKPVWMLQAHDSPVSAFDINPIVPGYLATGSDDKLIKLWNVQDNKPGMVVSRNVDVGRIFAAYFAPDPEVAFRLSVAGSKRQLQVWDTSTNASVRSAFGGKIKLPDVKSQERVVGVQDNVSDDDDSDDNEDGGVPAGDAGQDGWESMDED